MDALRTVEDSPRLCPSTGPDREGCVAFGVIGGTASEPRLRHLERPLPVTPELLSLSGPVRPTEVFRFAAPCARGECPNFRDDHCGLVTRIVRLLPAVVEAPPPCQIRPHCRWWHDEGIAACLRCPQVVTDNYNPSEAMRLASDPSTPD